MTKYQTDDERQALLDELAYINRSINWTISRADREGIEPNDEALEEPRLRAREIRSLLFAYHPSGF